MELGNIKQIKKLPRLRKDLHKVMADYSSLRLNDEREVTEISFIRHKYTNYEEKLNSLPGPPEDITHHDLMGWWIENENQHQAIKAQAVELAENMLYQAYGYIYDKPRKISNQELADLPEAWENPRVDTSEYYQSALAAWEVDQVTYNQHKASGGLCQEYKNRFYIA